jgi:uncharacterized membrane protein
MKKDKQYNVFFWSLYCLFFCPFSFGYCIVCSFVLFLLVIVLFVLLSFFFWLLYCLFFCPLDKRTNNTITKRKRTKEQTIQWPKENGQTTITKRKRTNNTITKRKRLLYCLFFCPFSFGYCIVCSFVLFLLVIVLFVLLLLVIVLFVLFLKKKDKQYNNQKKKDK